MKTAIFGGTFDPIHIGHYGIIKAISDSDFFDRVLVIPDKIPPHKQKNTQATDQERIEMCRMVCEDFKKAQLCLIEFEREGKSYTFDTLTALKQKYPKDDFYVVCGGDMIETLDTWYNFDSLKNMTSFIAFKRKGDYRFYESVEKMRNKGANIIVFNDDIADISSTELRKNIKKEFLPEKVYRYVIKRGIYKR